MRPWWPQCHHLRKTLTIFLSYLPSNIEVLTICNCSRISNFKKNHKFPTQNKPISIIYLFPPSLIHAMYIYIYIYISKKSKRVSKNPNNIYVIKKIKTKNVPWFWSGSLEHRCTQGGPDSKNQQEFQGQKRFQKTQKVKEIPLLSKPKKQKTPSSWNPLKNEQKPRKKNWLRGCFKGIPDHELLVKYRLQ